ncbi:MAG: HAD family hydrolase [Kineosporiaceae bacterium]|nr:HAD family hydrolase [Kineosporiaceae bacterium]MBK7624857.1 HAD family hydrolase [Kineosporiaceae bacterium]MBK8076764.1 HAD family hydrolase [Kineosporiaceae bacterium]
MSDLLPAAVLWDMDGTLVDTEPYWIACEYALVAAHGGVWSDDHAHALVGNDLLVSARYIADHGPVPLPPEQIVEILLDGVVERVLGHVPWRPGARELLSALTTEGIPSALVTMSWTRLADAVLASLPPDTFATVVTGDQVHRGKPHPEPYQLAARRLALAPAECVAIEDSPTGIASAAAAGVPVIGVQHLVPLAGRTTGPILTTLEGVTPLDLMALLRTS